jgi:hypothetical protein
MTKPVSKKMMKNRIKYVQNPYSWTTAAMFWSIWRKMVISESIMYSGKNMGSVSI